ncbi:1,4-alpha-glucan branching enzyme GlgB, partial [Frankliniella fusca]
MSGLQSVLAQNACSISNIDETPSTSIKKSRFKILSATPSEFAELPQTAPANFAYFWNSVEVENTTTHNNVAPSEQPTEENMQEELEPEEEDNAEDRHHENEDPIYPGAPVNLWESLTAILTFVQSEHISGVGLGRLLSLIDLHLPQPNNLLKTKHSVFKILEHTDEPVQLHYFCSVCYKSRKSPSELCDSCTDPARKVDYFITFSLAHQMKSLFKRPDFVQNIRYNQTRVKENFQNIEDIYDELKAESRGFTSNGITFMFNTDRVPVFKSNSLSLWPFYLVTLELPPQKRSLSENLIIAGIWGSTVKPHPNVFLVPIYKELLILKEGVNVQPHGESESQKVTGTLVCGTCDAPATASFLNMKSHFGFYSCPVCIIKGIHPGDSTVFPFVENVPLRNMEDYEGHVQRAVQDKIIFLKTILHEEPYCGIKGPTVLSYIFDNIFDSMSIDSMHCLYIGVMKQLLKLWFVDGKYQDKAKLLSEKLLEVLPPDYLQRKPQPVEKLIHWKASELRSFLYNLSIFLLQDILKPVRPPLFICESEEDLILAERLMSQFVREFEEISV